MQLLNVTKIKSKYLYINKSKCWIKGFNHYQQHIFFIIIQYDKTISKIKKKKYLKYTSQKVTKTPFFNNILCKNSKNRTSNSKCNSNNHNIQ